VSDRVSWVAEVDSPAVIAFDPLGEDSLVEAMRAVRAQGRCLREDSLALYNEHFSPEVWLASTISLYEQLIAVGKG
jgi:hypothetical protein